jgi:serine/threonine-protein kinase/endoribonuclease IRE1
MTLLRAFYTTTALALSALAAEYGNEIAALASSRTNSYRKRPLEDARSLPPLGGSGRTEETNDFDLLDIVLVATVDGKFHALNRTSGESMWSISEDGAAASAEVLSAMAPLVRTSHSIDRDPDLDDEDGAGNEKYIIEPQSGDIYVLASPSAPLQPFPFSMPQLVDMSPFTFTGNEDGRTFVGNKVTTLLTIELETGRVLRTVTSDSECPWEPPDEGVKSSLTDIDLDELEDSEAVPKLKSTSTEVHIGRTGALVQISVLRHIVKFSLDYHVTIHWSDRSRPRLPSQKLSFSVYGPNNQDLVLQSVYRRTADDAYLQSLPNGQVMFFKARSRDSTRRDSAEDMRLWGHNFANPV